MSEYIRTSRQGRVGHIVLDRPKALNALDLDMCVGIHNALDTYAADDEVEAVVVTSSGRHFCAGGDIKSIRAYALGGQFDECTRYFSTEYAMNRAGADLPKPYVAVMHGATMGGGLGASMHGDHRIVSETLMTSMPETAIGFIPDVGASWTLPRLCGGGTTGLAVAIYLGLTGARMDAADALYTGLATHHVPDGGREDLVRALEQLPLEVALGEYCTTLDAPSALEANLERIEEVFSSGTVGEMIDRLESGERDEWAETTLGQLRSMSPTSMVATTELMRAGSRAPDLAACLGNELGLGGWICRHPDFVEGVRAVLVDKSRDARWHPDALDDVDLDGIRAALG